MTFTTAEIAYLESQPLGRLATVAPDGTVQVNPVGVFVNAELGTIDIGGHRMGRTKKFRNVRSGGKVALVVDDLVSTDPWTVRCLEIRGRADALTDQPPPRPGFSPELIRIHPEVVFSYGIEDRPGMLRRAAA
ncbi:MAG TPA: PPOX class F420-dependent oxidoreductase [Streptosporangiales bacterium]